MKKCYLFLALAAGLLLASCQNEPENQLKKGDFEDVELKADSYWTADTNDGINSFTSGDFTFESYKMVSDYGTYYYGFMVSNITNTEFKDYTDAYKSACGGPRAGKNYAIWNSSYSGGDAVLLAKATKVPGCYITNNVYAYNSMLNGDAYAKKFGADDWFLLTITGHNGEQMTGTVDFYLAKDGKILKDWTYCDLSSLGEVTKLTFALSSTDNGDYGMNTPAYFCIDELGAKK